MDDCLRNRLRYCIWTDWKKPERKRKNLIRLGVDQDHAYAWSRTRKGGWVVTQSPILNSTITLKRLQNRGYQAMLKLYMELNPSIYEPPYTCPYHSGRRDPYAWPAPHLMRWWCERGTPLANGGAIYSIGRSTFIVEQSKKKLLGFGVS